MQSQAVQHTDGVNPAAKSKNGFIEFCRFIFVLSIVSHHAMFLSDKPGYIPLWGGYIAVEFFFILSGYLMYASYSKNKAVKDKQGGAIHQVYQKFKRFYLYFFISWGTIFVMMHVESGNTDFHTLFWEFIFGIPQLLFLQCVGLAGTGNNYNGTMWFASALLIGILIVYPLMCRCGKYFVTAIAPALCLICYGNVMRIGESLGSVHNWAGPVQAGCLRAVAGLCLGSVCCYLVKLIPKHELTKLGNAIVSFFQLGLVAFSLFLMSRTYGYTDIVQVMVFVLLITISFAEATTVNRIFDSKIFFSLGKFSMIVFVTQHVAYCSPDVLFYPQNWPWRYGMYIVYVLFFSLLNCLIVENIQRRHIINKIKQHLWKTSK